MASEVNDDANGVAAAICLNGQDIFDCYMMLDVA